MTKIGLAPQKHGWVSVHKKTPFHSLAHKYENVPCASSETFILCFRMRARQNSPSKQKKKDVIICSPFSLHILLLTEFDNGNNFLR